MIVVAKKEMYSEEVEQEYEVYEIVESKDAYGNPIYLKNKLSDTSLDTAEYRISNVQENLAKCIEVRDAISKLEGLMVKETDVAQVIQEFEVAQVIQEFEVAKEEAFEKQERDCQEMA